MLCCVVLYARAVVCVLHAVCCVVLCVLACAVLCALACAVLCVLAVLSCAYVCVLVGTAEGSSLDRKRERGRRRSTE